MGPQRRRTMRQDEKQALTIDCYLTFQEDMPWTLK